MINQPEDVRPVQLSTAGLRRKAAIGAELQARAAHMRAGRRVIIGAAGIALLGLATFAVVQSHSRALPPAIVDRTPPHVPSVAPDLSPAPPHEAVRITVVQNEPLPSRPCSASASPTPATQGGIEVCILSDDQLLNVLRETGESYGIVRVGGRTMVVANSTR